MKRTILVVIFAIVSIFGSGRQASANITLQQIAEYHAPVLVHQIGKNQKADSITRFDFDGDLIANNNWENLDKFPTPSYVYYDVKETKTHYFITYAFFHARDYSYLCIPWICHENDLEGAILTVRKDSEMGHVVLVETLAHDEITSYLKVENLKGLHPNPSGESPVALFIEWGGHGVFGWNVKEGRVDRTGVRKTANGFERQTLFEDDPLYDVMAVKRIYYFGGKAQNPDAAQGAPVSYDLLPIETHFWNDRDLVGRGRMFVGEFKYGGTRFNLGTLPAGLAGEKFGLGRAHPPWAWKDSNNGDEKKGDWFLDPAVVVAKKFPTLKISRDYKHNPYIGIQ